MPSQTVNINNGQQLQVNTNLAKLFPWHKEFKQFTYTNATGGAVALAAGRIMGRVNASGKVLPVDSAAVDGSQYPMGVLGKDVSIANGVTISVPVSIRGEVRSDMISWKAGDTVATVVGGRRLDEWLEDRVILRDVANGTKYENTIP